MAGLLDFLNQPQGGGLFGRDPLSQYRRQRLFQGVGDTLLSLATGMQQRSAPGINPLEVEEYRRQQEAQQKQDFSRQALFTGGMPAGRDPRTGITWDRGRQGLGDRERLGLLGQAYPKAAGEALVARAFPKPPEPFTLSPGAARYGPGGEVVAQQPFKPDTLSPEALRQKKEIARAGKSETSFSLGPQETEEQKARGKSLVAQYEAVNERAASAEDAINQLSIAKAVAATSELPSQLKSTAGNMAVALGIPLPAGLSESITSGQAFTGVMQNLVLTKMQAQKGPQTENDAKRIQATLANLGNTPEARGFLMEVGINLARRDVMERDFWETWYANEGTYDGAARAWNKHIGGVPLVGFNEQTPDLPIFYPEFETIMREDRPDITEQEILRLWKKYYGGG